MESLELLERLEDVIDKAVHVPFTGGKGLIDKEDILNLIQDIKLKLPDDMKQARWVKEERQRILTEAKQEAETLLKEAENKIIALVDESEITRQAIERGNEIVQSAKTKAREINVSSFAYADDILEQVEKALIETAKRIKGTAAAVQTNRKDLRQS